MVQDLLSIRRAEPADAASIAGVHDESWREAYRGIIPGRALEALIMRRGAAWWLSAIRRGSHILVLDYGADVVGYVTFGRNRFRPLRYASEIFELYLAPKYQGLGFGERLFDAACRDLSDNGYLSTLVWALEENNRALRFYKRLGGVEVWRGVERFGTDTRVRIAFGFADR